MNCKHKQLNNNHIVMHPSTYLSSDTYCSCHCCHVSLSLSLSPSPSGLPARAVLGALPCYCVILFMVHWYYHVAHIYPSICLSIYLSTYLSIYLCQILPICLIDSNTSSDVRTIWWFQGPPTPTGQWETALFGSSAPTSTEFSSWHRLKFKRLTNLGYLMSTPD